MKCVVCASRNREREVDTGHVCPPCAHSLAVDIAAIVDHVAIAAVMPDPMATRPSANGSRPAPSSRPPLDVQRIDPELVLIRAEPTDPTSDVPLLELLESWVRLIREERNMSPYGPASHLWATHSHERIRSGVPVRVQDSDPLGTLTETRVTLVGVCGFLSAQVTWMTTTPDFPIEQLSSHVRRATATLKALDLTREKTTSWRIPCPTAVESQHFDASQGLVMCGNKLTIDPADLHGDIHCRDCDSTWTAQRLLLLVLSDPAIAIWQPADVIVDALGIPLRTLQRWAEQGVVGCRRSMYDAGAAFRQRHVVSKARIGA